MISVPGHKYGWWLSVALWPASVPAGDAVSQGVDDQAQLPYWELRHPGMRLRLVQRLPDQTRAFFLARGFSREQVEVIADNCVFQSVFANTSGLDQGSALTYDMDRWKVMRADSTQGLQTREYWQDYWEQHNAPKAARIALEWALLPTRQVYQPSDYNWGMSIFGLKPGSRFDLEVSWSQFDVRHRAVIEGLQCAKDVSLEPRQEGG